MHIAILLGFLQIVSVPDSSSILNESKEQASYYIQQIDNGENVEANLWALALLTSEKDAIKAFVEGETRSNESLSSFQNIKGSYTQQLEKVALETGSSNLLIAALLSTEQQSKRQLIFDNFAAKHDFSASNSVDYRKLCDALINNEAIKNDILTQDTFLLPHFFILFYDSYDTFFSEEYVQSLKENWSVNSSSSDNLESSLTKISYFRTLYLTDNYSETASLYHSLINDQLFPNSSIKLQIYRYLDYSMYRLGHFDRNLEIARSFTLPLSKYLNQKALEVRTKYTIGINLYSIGKVQEARKVYQEVLKETQKNNYNIPKASLFNNLALTHLKLGKYQQYLDLQFQALENAKESGNYSHELKTLNNIFVYYRDTNNPETALSYLKEARKIAENKANPEDLGNIYISFGSFYRKFHENYSKAHEFYSKAEENLNKENAQYYIKLLNEQAETFENQQKYSHALKKHDRVIELTKDEGGAYYLDALVNKALIHLKMGNIEEAEQFIEQYSSPDLEQLDFAQLIKAKTVEADYLQRVGNQREALEILEPVLDQVVARAKSSADLKSGYWHVANEFLDAFELTVSIYRETGQPEKAIQKLDQLKTINDASLYQNPLVKSSVLNESELTQYKQLTDQLDNMRKKLLAAPEDRQFEIRQTISQLNVKKRQLDEKLTKQINSDPITIREIQNQLSARELVLHYTELNDQYYIAKISRSNISLRTIPLDSKIRNLLSNSVQQIATNETNLDSLYKITETLGLRVIPDRIEQITLIPDSYLYQLPIDILPLNKPTQSYSYGNATYMIEEFRTQYLTSLEDFGSDSKRSNIQNKLSYTGYGVSNFDSLSNESLVPLPFAQTEVKNIASRLTQFSDVQTFTNEQSTKSVFKQKAPQSQIIHLATHSEVSERDPMFSTVYLSNSDSSVDSTFNSQIFAYELFELDLSNEMIMLNSCESGSGPYIQGTGVMGMSRALRYAGANSLVLNLWSVNDMLASDFAIYFYDQLNKGKSKAEALRDTKRYFLSSKNANPHFWGPYMLIGNPDPIVQPDQDTNMAMAGAFIFYFLLMISLSYLTQQGFIFNGKKSKQAA